MDFAIRYLIEIDFFNGYICDRGREHGAPTPVNNAVQDMVREIEDGKRQMSLSNVKDSVFERIKAKGKR